MNVAHGHREELCFGAAGMTDMLLIVLDTFTYPLVQPCAATGDREAISGVRCAEWASSSQTSLSRGVGRKGIQ